MNKKYDYNMKRLGLYLLLIGLVAACQKEDDIIPSVGYENLYPFFINSFA